VRPLPGRSQSDNGQYHGKTRSRINIGRKYGRAVRREFRGAATKSLPQEFRGAGSRLEIPEWFGRPYLHPYSVAAVRFIPDIASPR